MRALCATLPLSLFDELSGSSHPAFEFSSACKIYIRYRFYGVMGRYGFLLYGLPSFPYFFGERFTGQSIKEFP